MSLAHFFFFCLLDHSFFSPPSPPPPRRSALRQRPYSLLVSWATPPLTGTTLTGGRTPRAIIKILYDWTIYERQGCGVHRCGKYILFAANIRMADRLYKTSDLFEKGDQS